MPFIIALIVIIVVAYLWIYHPRNSGDVMVNTGNSLQLSTQRLKLNHQMNMHPSETIEDRQLTIAEIASAIIQLDVLHTSRQRQLLTSQIRSILRVYSAEAKEMILLRRCLTVR